MKVFLAYKVGGWLPVIGGGCSLNTDSALLCNHSKNSIQMVSEHVHVQLVIETGHLLFLKHL